MANVLKIKRSSVAGKLPLTTDLQLGELAINTTDGRLFTKKNVSATDYIVEFLSTDSAFKTNAVVATTANITLSATQTIDGVMVAVGDRVLVKDQSSAAQNGVYIVAAGAWTRAPDMDTAAKCAGAKVSVNSGTTNGGRCFDTDFKSTDTLGTTSMSWSRALDMGAVGVDVQAYDADLSAIAGLAGTSGFLKKTGTNAWTLDTSTYASISSSNVFTANQDFGNGTGAVYLDLNGAAGSDRALVFKTAGVTRWTFNANTSAESGSNAGSNFELYRHTDAGAYIDTVWSINRSTGVTNLKELTLGTDLAVAQGGTGVSTLTGIVKGNGTSAFSAAVAGTDYVPPAGTGATGTWGISISGNAATVSNITRTTDTTTDLNSLTTSGFYRVNTNTNTPSPYGQMITAYGGGDTIGQLYFNYTNGYIYTRAGNPAIVGGVGSWSAWRTVLNDDNVGTYAVRGTVKLTVATTAPGSPATGDLWVDTN